MDTNRPGTQMVTSRDIVFFQSRRIEPFFETLSPSAVPNPERNQTPRKNGTL